jgi:glycosyltransferase involved in cell wall biosynthesis
MKIMHVVQLLHSNGGIERLVLAMLKEAYANASVFVIQGSAEFALKNVPALAAYQDKLYFANLEESGKKKTVGFLRALCKTLSISVIHTHYTGPLLYANLATTGLGHITHVHTEHDVWHLNFWKFFLLEKLLFASKKQIKLVAVSHQVQTGLLDYFAYKNPLLIHNGIDTNAFKPGDKYTARAYFRLPDSAIILGSAGTLIPLKGHQFLIQAMKELPATFHLAIAGDGPLFHELTALIQTMKMQDRIHLLGSVELMDLFYQACDLFCHPSITEGLPLALLEAQATNLPTVCSNVGGCSEALDPESGLLIEPKNPQAIARACLLLSEREGNPRNFIITNFSLETMMKKYDSLYRS